MIARAAVAIVLAILAPSGMTSGLEFGHWAYHSRAITRCVPPFENVLVFEISNNYGSGSKIAPDRVQGKHCGGLQSSIHFSGSVGDTAWISNPFASWRIRNEAYVPFFDCCETSFYIYQRRRGHKAAIINLSISPNQNEPRRFNVTQSILVASHRYPSHDYQTVGEERDSDVSQFRAAKPWVPEVFTFGGLALVCIGGILAIIGSRREHDDVLELLGIVVLACGWFLGYYLARLCNEQYVL
ncbi:MAG TPA: hypothetical protein VGT78_13850 [Rhizomicrobium sp.]|nr:hypothetical protein [Rhizomicrobium sp.]